MAIVPWLKTQFETHRQQQIISDWQQGLILQAEDTDLAAIDSPYPLGTSGEGGEADTATCIGLLHIPSIDLELPLLEGTTKQNLRYGATTIEPTVRPGEVGNLAVAGHNSQGYGRNFNRLGELQAGDQIEVETEGKIDCYIVTETFCVDPEETQVLSGDGEKRLITLVTCYPRDTATRRLIVRGECSG